MLPVVFVGRTGLNRSDILFVMGSESMDHVFSTMRLDFNCDVGIRPFFSPVSEC